MLIFYLNSLFFRFLYRYTQIDKHSTKLNAIKAGFHVGIITETTMLLSSNLASQQGHVEAAMRL